MKRIFAILVAATMVISMFAMTTIVNAATADTVFESVEGTATIDGTMDDGYANALHLVLDQYGTSNGGGAKLDSPAADVYIMNDAEWVYVFYDVHDTELDNTSANYYEQDSIELFYMEDNTKNQWRIHYDADNADPDQTKVPTDQYAVALTDGGYAVECKIPITDVKDNSIETLVQIDACTGGKRDGTVYVTDHPEGDDGWQRDNRQTDYDVWWTLKLAGTFEDTRVDPVPVAEEITVKNYQSILSRAFSTQIFVQDQATWSLWNTFVNGPTIALGSTEEISATGLMTPIAADALTPELTSDYTKAPKFAVQVSDGAMVDGEKEEYGATYSDITIKATGYNDVIVPGATVAKKLTAKEESWGMGGNSWEIDLGTPIMTDLGLTVEQFCKEYLPAVTDISMTLSFDTFNLNDLATVQAFVDNLATLEQQFVDESLAEYTTKVNDALTAAQAANGDVEALNKALDDATKAVNRATKEVENNGYAADGIAGTYVTETLAPIVEQIQGMVDEAAAAAAPAEEEAPAPAEEEPADNSSSSSSEGGSSAGPIIAIVVIVVVVIAAVVGIVLGKKKK